jgi:colanic acid biosynthesis glycosyl transferase WcaI
MAAWLASRGHEVIAVAGLPHYPGWRVQPPYDDGAARVEWWQGLRVLRVPHWVPGPEDVGARARIRMEMSFTFRAARYWVPWLFRRARADVVVAVWPPMQLGLYPLLYRWLRGVPWVLHVQDLQAEMALRLGFLRGRGLARGLYRVESFLLRRATRVSTITEAMRRRIVAKGVADERSFLTPNWADLEAVRPRERDNRFRVEQDVGYDSLLVLYAGNMGRKQGLEVVLEAAVRLAGDRRLRFLLVGDGAARAELERRAGELRLRNVRFLPVQPAERLGEMLAAGDIHLVVQRREAADLVMPSKLSNILAAGRASVVTADPETELYRVVAGNGLGVVCAPDDAVALAAAIQRLVDNAALREAAGQRARAYAERHLGRDGILSTFEARLAELVQKSPGRGRP